MFDRAGWLAYWKGAELKEALLGDISVQPEGADMKVAYTLNLRAPLAGSASATGFRVVSVWQQIKARLVLTTTSITPIR
jgi:hypothetical protein